MSRHKTNRKTYKLQHKIIVLNLDYLLTLQNPSAVQVSWLVLIVGFKRERPVSMHVTIGSTCFEEGLRVKNLGSVAQLFYSFSALCYWGMGHEANVFSND